MIDEFKATLGKRGFSKPTMFRVEFVNIPSEMLKIGGINEILVDIPFFAETAEFPGVQFLTQEIRYYGLSEKIVYGKAHDELNITFRLDRDFQIRKFFDVWENVIYDKKTGNVKLKRNYVGTIQIYQVMENGFSSYVLELEDAYPVQIGQISLGWDQANSYSRLPVTFTYKKMRVVANRQIFQRPNFGTSGNILNQNENGSFFNNMLSKEIYNNNPLSFSKTNVTSILNNKNLGSLKQISVMNKNGLGNLFRSGFGGLEFG